MCFGTVSTAVFAGALALLVGGCSAWTFVSANVACALVVVAAFVIDAREERKREMLAVSACEMRVGTADGATATLCGDCRMPFACEPVRTTTLRDVPEAINSPAAGRWAQPR